MGIEEAPAKKSTGTVMRSCKERIIVSDTAAMSTSDR